MFTKLQTFFPSLVIFNEINEINSEYQWFITNENEIIGIHNNELTPKDIALLSTLLQPLNMTFPTPTENEQMWKEVINGTKQANELPNHPYRFIYFSMNENQIDPRTFKSAIQALFFNSISILWENEQEGIIIEKKIDGEDIIDYEQIIDVLMSDLYVNINFFVGPFFKKNTYAINEYYQFVLDSAQTAFIYYSEKSVTTYIDAIPAIFVHHTKDKIRETITTVVLKEYINDKDTLKMIKAFLNCNLNISVTAKALYMHRNSLQYRLDKFLENTGIDIRNFHQAMTVYLALIANHQKS